MTTTTRAYRIDVEFFSGGDLFASDTISFHIEDGADVWCAATTTMAG